MKTVILAGGLGSRLSEETQIKPKPMVEIGGKPILWHIMKIYSAHGFHDFIICCGYRGYMIKEYFANYFLHMSDVTFDIRENRMEVHQKHAEPWSVTVVDTGDSTLTGGRIRRVREYVGDEDFMLTYGDGVSDIDIAALVNDHEASGRDATLTAVKPPGRYGALQMQDKQVNSFTEKADTEDAWINGGFFVLKPRIFDLIADDQTSWESEPLQQLAAEGQLNAYKHEGFWHAMDTLREKSHLETLWQSGNAPWKRW